MSISQQGLVTSLVLVIHDVSSVTEPQETLNVCHHVSSVMADVVLKRSVLTLYHRRVAADLHLVNSPPMCGALPSVVSGYIAIHTTT